MICMTDHTNLSFFKELYHYSDDCVLVADTVSDHLYIKKTLSVYNKDVFAYLKDHHDPHIPRVYSYSEENGKLTVLEEVVQGSTLEYVLINEHPDEEERLRILYELCLGVEFLHHAVPPIIHRDIKASNIMICDDGSVKLIDYDAAKIY